MPSRSSTPTDFKKQCGRNTVQLILDAIGVQVGHPSNPEIARYLWSAYYHMYGALCCVGSTVI